MYKKIILSTAASLCLTTSVFGFDSDKDGNIYSIVGDTLYNSTYQKGIEADETLKLSDSQYGDALIYPMYKSDKGWKTKIMVRNNSADAVVAKVVLYDNNDSRELRDFNIYLSAYDVFTFEVNGNDILTKDGSIPSGVTTPGQSSATDKAEFVSHEGNTTYGILSDTNTTLALDEQEGYIAIYGMAQSKHDFSSTDKDALGNDIHYAYHGKHLELFKDYRRLLDVCRPSWRSAYADSTSMVGIKKGMISTASNLQAPNVAIGTCNPDDNNIATREDEFFSPKNVLSGTVRLINSNTSKPSEQRDMLLPATALQNFTTDNMTVLWTEGEYAAIQDRRINNNLQAKYDSVGILNDASAFDIKTADYTFNGTDSANQLIFTQPMKRILVQLDPDNGNGYYNSTESSIKSGHTITTDFGCFKLDLNTAFNENEAYRGFVQPKDEPLSLKPLISPYSTNILDVAKPSCGFSNEMEKVTDDQLQGTSALSSINQNGGFMKVKVTANNGKIPAIVTQMVGSVSASGNWQTNWVYAPVVK